MLAFVGILDGMRQSIFRSAQNGTAQFDSSDVEDIDRNLESLFPLVEQVFDRHMDVIEKDLTGRRPLNSHLLFLGVFRNPFGMSVYDEGREVFVIIDFGEYNHDIRESPIGDPHLLSVDDIVLAVLAEFGLGLSAVGIGAGTRLGEAIAAF